MEDLESWSFHVGLAAKRNGGLLGRRKGGMDIFVRMNVGAVVWKHRAKDMLATVHLGCMETWKSGGHG